jgi:hypothetical protein
MQLQIAPGSRFDSHPYGCCSLIKAREAFTEATLLRLGGRGLDSIGKVLGKVSLNTAQGRPVAFRYPFSTLNRSPLWHEVVYQIVNH